MKTNIVPVQFWPHTADVFVLIPSGFQPPPFYNWKLCDSNERTFSTGSVQMTEQAWQNWPADLGIAGDQEYQLNAICSQLNLTRA